MYEANEPSAAEGTVVSPISKDVSWDEWIESWRPVVEKAGKYGSDVIASLQNIKDETQRARLRQAFSETGIETLPRRLTLLQQLSKSLERKNPLEESGVEVL